jgi:hypothetical protein
MLALVMAVAGCGADDGSGTTGSVSTTTAPASREVTVASAAELREISQGTTEDTDWSVAGSGPDEDGTVCQLVAVEVSDVGEVDAALPPDLDPQPSCAFSDEFERGERFVALTSHPLGESGIVLVTGVAATTIDRIEVGYGERNEQVELIGRHAILPYSTDREPSSFRVRETDGAWHECDVVGPLGRLAVFCD